MNNCYRFRSASVDLLKYIDSPEVWIVSYIRTRGEYGKGYASAVLRKACEDADREGVCLLLSVAPDEECVMSEQQLADWYARYGFQSVDSEDQACKSWMLRVATMDANKIDKPSLVEIPS